MGFYEELRAQPQRLRALLESIAQAHHPRRSQACARLLEKPKLLLTGMGSSLYACYPV